MDGRRVDWAKPTGTGDAWNRGALASSRPHGRAARLADAKLFDVENGAAAQLGNPHVRDAGICALAAVDFLEGTALPPTDERAAAEEGWIWVRERS